MALLDFLTKKTDPKLKSMERPLNLRMMGQRATNPLEAKKVPETTIPSNMIAPPASSANPLQKTNQPAVQPPKIQSATTTPSQQFPSYAPMANGGTNPIPQQTNFSTVTQPSPTTQPPTYPGILSTLTQRATQEAPQVTEARDRLLALQTAQAETKKNIAGLPIEYVFQQGRQGAAQQYFAEKENAASNALQSAVTSQGQQLGALGTATGLAQPVQLPYSNQYIDPTTGQPVGGGQTGNMNEAVGTIAQRLKSGQMGYNEAVQALSGYGQGGLNALQQALGSDFNVPQSIANAQAQVQGLQQNVQTGLTMQRSAQSANQALSTLQSLYEGLGPLSKGNIPFVDVNVPILGEYAQKLGMNLGVGREAISAYQGALKEARAQINTVLAPLVGVESANATSNSLLPDNMLPQEIPQKIGAAREYIQQRVGAFTQPGNVPQYGQSSQNTGPISWDDPNIFGQ